MSYAMVGGTASQRDYVLELLDNPRLPELKWGMTVRIADLGPLFNGIANPWTIKLSERLRSGSSYWRHVVYHEFGHVFDYHYLSPDVRAVVMGFLDEDDTSDGWHGPFIEPWRRRPKEQFADEFDNFIRCREPDNVPRSLIGRMIVHADPTWQARNPTLRWGCT